METATQARTRAGYQGNRGYSLAEAAEALGCSQRTLWRQIQTGEIKSVKISPRRRVVTAAEIARVLSGAAVA
jgi:excisionase family DNA binding protein